ncbi:MAG: hypothetical protein ACR2OU_02930 [Thermomicrobiales bacterium]
MSSNAKSSTNRERDDEPNLQTAAVLSHSLDPLGTTHSLWALSGPSGGMLDGTNNTTERAIGW